MHAYQTALRTGIARTREFERKKLAEFAVNVGTKCGHDCTYCSSGALLRMHAVVQAGRAQPISNPAMRSSIRIRTGPRGPRRPPHAAARLVQLCTTVDAWSPEAQEHDLGRRCLKALLVEPGWTVRILTKNAVVTRDFDLIRRHRDRVLVGLSITGTPTNEAAISAIEPHASSISERIAALRQARSMGLRTYAMFCPLLPGIGSDPAQIDGLIRLAVECGAEEIFVEPVNARGPGLKRTQEALVAEDHDAAAAAISRIRAKPAWSQYVVNLIRDVQRSVHAQSDIAKLRILLYPSRLLPEDAAAIQNDDEGVIWLDKPGVSTSSASERTLP